MGIVHSLGDLLTNELCTLNRGILWYMNYISKEIKINIKNK